MSFELIPSPLRVDAGAVDPRNHRLEGYVPARVRLRVEEHLDVPHVVLRGPLKIAKCQVVEVLHVLQHVGAAIVDVEERLEIMEVVGLADGVHVVPRQRDAVTPCEREHQLGLERAFDMQVQLRLRNAANECLEGRIVGHHALQPPAGQAPPASPQCHQGRKPAAQLPRSRAWTRLTRRPDPAAHENAQRRRRHAHACHCEGSRLGVGGGHLKREIRGPSASNHENGRSAYEPASGAAPACTPVSRAQAGASRLSCRPPPRR